MFNAGNAYHKRRVFWLMYAWNVYIAQGGCSMLKMYVSHKMGVMFNAWNVYLTQDGCLRHDANQVFFFIIHLQVVLEKEKGGGGMPHFPKKATADKYILHYAN